MKTRLRISQTQRTDLVDIATSSLPNESCALLAGEVKDMKIWKDVRVIEIFLENELEDVEMESD